MIVEMRTYKLKPNTRKRFLQVFRSRSVPEHRRLGMKILGPFLSIEDPNTLFFMRGFPDLPSHETLKASFYGWVVEAPAGAANDAHDRKI